MNLYVCRYDPKPQQEQDTKKKKKKIEINITGVQCRLKMLFYKRLKPTKKLCYMIFKNILVQY